MSTPRAGNRDRDPPGESSDRLPSSVDQVRRMLPLGGGLWRESSLDRGQAFARPSGVQPPAITASFPGPPSVTSLAKDATIPPELSAQPAIEGSRGLTVHRDGQDHQLHRLSPEERARFRRHVSLVVFLSTGAILVIALYLLLRIR